MEPSAAAGKLLRSRPATSGLRRAAETEEGRIAISVFCPEPRKALKGAIAVVRIVDLVVCGGREGCETSVTEKAQELEDCSED